jgi:signal transduction histidine kinase/CheY-like chemotaxis protein
MIKPRNLQDRISIAFGSSGAPAPDAGAGGLAAIHDAMGDITVSRDLEGVILSANRTFREVAGIDNPIGRTCEEFGITFQPGRVAHSYDVVFSDASHRRVFLWHDIVVRDPLVDGLVIQSIAREVTEERLQAEAGERARLDAEEESQRKSRLIAMVSHEIRTPLSGLLGMGYLLAGTELTPTQANYLEGIRQAGTDLAQLVEDLLDFSTLSAGRFHLRPRLEPIRPMIENVVEMLASRAHAKGIEIGAIIDPSLPAELELDPGRFRQVLFNVIGNAVKFTETGGILVRAVRDETGLTVHVEDTGPGMKPSELARIFEAFEQGDLSRAREGGVGLGLAISARIMAEAGGAITVESELGRGTTFSIRLPVEFETAGMRLGGELSSADVLLLAPEGPAARAIAASITQLGARVRCVNSLEAARYELARRPANGVIVDHRLDADFAMRLAREPALAGARKVFLVSPESRPATMSDDVYDGWLIRPLREQSLIDVLTGRLQGLESRRADREEFPVLAPEAGDDGGSRPQVTHAAGVILAEDDPVNAMIVRMLLEREGFEVRLVTSFARLSELHAEQPASLIVTDKTLEDGTCEGFIASLRDHEDALRVTPAPIIVLTADSRQETRRDLLSRGANLVLFKPAQADSFLAAVHDLLGRHAA